MAEMRLYIEVVQLSGNTYFWRLRDNNNVFARSSNIDTRDLIMNEAERIAECLTLDIIVYER